jgi:curli biogenesis system outer membrane secretion channel CsgG
MFERKSLPLVGAGLLATLALGACATSSESASSDAMTSHVGMYNPPPSVSVRPRVGVPPFSVSGDAAKREMNTVAADQMTTLMVQCSRFNVIERAQLETLLAEQNLSGIVKPGEMAATGAVNGVDYLLIGKVTNLRVKTTKKDSSFGLGNIGNSIGLTDVAKDDVEVKTDCGVDIRLVDPSSGAIVMANFSEFSRKDKATAYGIEILGANAKSSADISISEDDYGKILRLALDDALRKSLPKVDQWLMTLSSDS